ncbi:hypothetical protein CAPTEDRAFT_171303 [Capitella teleta]|uniref:Membrane insertase YidC/Oxa/ALB C-terminal domain-containing protein n=1 Tax=Capitella teleta TaxID=283909 RepID=R7T725_CAPTE|nr:hypothetical protein CAPTEDRAFT_171303 [Capitella teleta]|eukprot:ELT87155.1 hypothetical protein CAPTEDRAFT_171303 [Capitella teleta]
MPAGYIPEPPSAINEVTTSDEILTAATDILSEPTLSSLGLCNYTPPGLYQSFLEMLHVSFDLPWFAAIALTTVAIRICLFPVVIRGQRNAVNISNHMPTVQKLQADLTKARASGDASEVYRISNEMGSYIKRNNVNPLKAMVMPLIQAPIFLSVYYGIRSMVNVPVQSMTTGGLLWFTDLTIPDPYFLLPVMTSLTLLLTLESGVDAQRSSTMTPTMRTVMRVIPFVMLPVTINMPAAMLCYWATSNVVSLFQVGFLRLPGMRQRLNIPEYAAHSKAHVELKKKGFVEGFKESMHNSKLISEIEQRKKSDAVRFREAGIQPIEKTYAYDPTKVKRNQKKKS